MKEYHEQEQEINTLRSKIYSLQVSNESLREEKERLATALQSLEKEHTELHEKYTIAVRDSIRYKEDIEYANRRVQELEDINASVNKENEQLKHYVVTLKQQINELHTKIGHLTKDVDTLQINIHQQQQQQEQELTSASLYDDNSEWVKRAEYDDVSSALEASQGAKDRAEKERDDLRQEHIELHKHVSKLEVELEGAAVKRDEAKRMLVETERRVAQLEGTIFLKNNFFYIFKK